VSVSTVTCNIDAYVDQARAWTNFGNKSVLMMNNDTNKKYAYIFGPKNFQDGDHVYSSIFSFFVKSGWVDVGGTTVTADVITMEWKEGHINWGNKPSVYGGAATVVVAQNAVDGTRYNIDITSFMGAVADGTRGWWGLVLTINKTGDHSIYSSEAVVGYRPYITTTWYPPPAAPTDLVPVGDKAVSLARPTYNWSFNDSFGDSIQAKSQLQISSSSSFTSPLYDSTLITNAGHQYTPAYDLTDNTKYYWRVRVEDNRGYTSPYTSSYVSTFYRRTKGTSSLTSPAATEYQITPLVTFSQLSGRTQAAAEYLVQEYNSVLAAYQTVYTKPRMEIASTGSITWSIPDGIIKTSSRNYKAIARIYDTIDRINTPGDSAYVEVSQVFTFARDAGTTGTASLTGTQSGAGIVLNWTRASTPDFFVIRVDGEYIDHDLDGEFRFYLAPYSGTSYHVTIYGLTSDIAHTVEVEAVVLATSVYKHSSSNSIANITPSIKGIWLVEPVSGTSVQFLAEEPDFEIGEQAGIFYTVGGRKPIMITSAVRGYEGSVEGLIPGITYRDNLETLKGQLNTKELRLIFSDLNIPVLLGKITGPVKQILPTGVIYYRAGFEFYQSGQFTVDITGTT